MSISRILRILILLPVVLSAFLNNSPCKAVSADKFAFKKMLVDVALDKEHNLLKFFINTKVIDISNSSNTLPVIQDVNATTNRFTTFHATLWFMGKQIVDENKRFCQMVGVKNTTQYYQGPRFYNHSKPNTTIVVNPYGPIEVSNGYLKPAKRDGSALINETYLDNQDAVMINELLGDDTSAYISYATDVEYAADGQEDTTNYADEQNYETTYNAEEENTEYYDTTYSTAQIDYDYSDETNNGDYQEDNGEYQDDTGNTDNYYDPNNDYYGDMYATATNILLLSNVFGDAPEETTPPESSTVSSEDAASTLVSSYVLNSYTDTEKDISFASSNETISQLFSNDTGDFVGCPLYVNDSIYIYYEVDISDQMRNIGSFSARFSIISNDDESLILACSKVYITPTVNSSLQNGILFGALALLLATGINNFLTVMHSSYQESENPFLFTASTICNRNLLRQLDATVQRIIVYLQFALFTAGLNLNYPGFYQPLLALLKWSALLGFSFIKGNNFYTSTELDNIYLTYNADGLNSLSYFGNYKTSGTNWWNFIITLVIWVSIQISCQAIYFIFKYLKDNNFKNVLSKSDFKVNFRRTLSLMMGVALNNFLMFFGFPFLVLTIYMFYLAAENKDQYSPNIDTLQADSFSRDTSYDSLFSPISYIVLNYGHNLSSNIAVDNEFINQGYNITSNSTTNITIVDIDSGVETGPVVMGSILFALWIGLSFFFISKYLIGFSNWKLAVSKNVHKLYTSVNTVLCWAFFYHHYHPEKNYFVIVDIVQMILKLLVISLIQVSGLSQVICLIVLEFVGLAFLVVLKPFYLELSWTTTRWMIPFARILVTMLCIPFIESLDVAEEQRTYVAYAQLIIHVVIAFAFLGQLMYCFISTVLTIIKHRKKSLNDQLEEKLTKTASLEEFKTQFEYRPIESLLKPIQPYRIAQETDNLVYDDSSMGSTHKFDVSNSDYYYRYNSSNINGKLAINGLDNTSITSETESFKRLRETADERRKQNDYTTREADNIYRKFFLNDDIDEDMKQLWESRKMRSNLKPRENIKVGNRIHDKLDNKLSLFKTFGKKTVVEEEKGFHVSRPRPLVVRKMPSNNETDDAHSTEEETFSDSISSIDRKPSTKTTYSAKSGNTYMSSIYEDAQSSLNN